MKATSLDLDEIAARDRADAEEADRERFRDLMRSSLRCVAWGALGMFCVAWSVHTTDVAYGKMAFFAGLGAGNGGVIFTLLGAYRRGERRGDW
jgi:hypothetical protein